jgi:hypothetical protein
VASTSAGFGLQMIGRTSKKVLQLAAAIALGTQNFVLLLDFLEHVLQLPCLPGTHYRDVEVL